MTEPRLETSRKVYTNHWSLQLSRFMKGSCCWRKSVFSMINSILWRKETHKQHLYQENDLKMIVIFHNYHKMIWIFDAFLIFILRNKCELFKTESNSQKSTRPFPQNFIVCWFILHKNFSRKYKHQQTWPRISEKARYK